jgi:hypothetical protein
MPACAYFGEHRPSPIPNVNGCGAVGRKVRIPGFNRGFSDSPPNSVGTVRSSAMELGEQTSSLNVVDGGGVESERR